MTTMHQFIWPMISCLLFAGCSPQTVGGNEAVALVYEGAVGCITFEHKGEKYRVCDESMSYVTDWSDDYSRGIGVGVILNGEFCVFSGRINHSRDIFYAFNLADRSLITVKNAVSIAVSPDLGWATLHAPPLYSSAAEDENAEVVLTVNGVEIGGFKQRSVGSMHWSRVGLEITFKGER